MFKRDEKPANILQNADLNNYQGMIFFYNGKNIDCMLSDYMIVHFTVHSVFEPLS